MDLTIPRFEIGEELGRGANSVVFRAKLDGVACALKVPRSRGQWTRWVYREAVSLARVRAPGLPKVIEVGEHDGIPYLAMELVEGTTLAQRLTAGPLEADAVVALGATLLGTLAQVHAASLVHRDVKPRNLILLSHGALKLVDFGFATPIERAARPAPVIAGTLGYSAPEQLQAPSRIDARADLYAVGVVLAECLTADLPRSVSAMERVGSLRFRKTDPALVTLIETLLSISPEDRYPSAEAAMGELERIRRGAAILGPRGYPRPHPAAPLVGRKDELAKLGRLLIALENGEGRVALVHGASGSGKTRLLLELEEKARRMFSGRTLLVPSRDGDPPLAVLRRVLEAFANTRGHAALREAASSHLAPFVRFIAPSLEAAMGPAKETGTPASGFFAESVTELLLALGRAGSPLVLIVDDVQWTDAASRDALIRVAHRIADAPLLLVMAGRTLSGPLARLDSLDPSKSVVIEPAPFGTAEIEALVRSHLGDAHIDPGVTTLIATLTDFTPLGTLEVLRAFLDTGALRPTARGWHLDVARAERATLPDGAVALLSRRVHELPAATRRVLEAAAVLGTTFQDELLACVIGLEVDDLGYALAESTRAGVTQVDAPSRHRFTHDSLRDSILRDLPDVERRALHQRVAEELERRGGTSAAELFATADHYAAGEIEKAPRRVCAVARAAAQAALGRFDNEVAIRYFEQASRAANLASVDLDSEFFAGFGEAWLRLGALDKSLRAFDASLSRATDPIARASILARIAWVHQCAADHDASWSALARAFKAVGARMPVEGALSIAETIARSAKFGLTTGTSRAPVSDISRIALLCGLHSQTARLGMESGRPLRFVQSILQSIELSDRIGTSKEQARARAYFGLLHLILGRNDAGARHLDHAKRTATELGDPAIIALCVQLHAVAMCFAGAFDDALVLLGDCLDKHGRWLEITEYHANVANADVIESLRGRAQASLSWLQRAIDLARRSDQLVPFFSQYLVHRVRACFAALGRDVDSSDRWLATQIRTAEQSEPENGFFKVTAWGCHARGYLERRDFGAGFERLVAGFDSERHNPRFSHPLLAEYYIAVAHARVEQVLLARAAGGDPSLDAVDKTLSELRLAAKLPLFKAHRYLIEAWASWFHGKSAALRRSLTSAEELATNETCPWVLCGVARLRAHALRAEGKVGAALDQAHVAEALAREHGALPRARAIRAEFGLVEPVAGAHTSSVASHSSAARHKLASLLHVTRAALRDLRPEPQAIAILDEVIRDASARRATLVFQPDPSSRTQLALGRDRDAQTYFGVDGWRAAFLKQVRDRDEPERSAGVTGRNGATGLDAVPREAGIDPSRVLGIPLYLYDRSVGAMCLERDAAARPFDEDSGELLDVLSQQVPLALELARLLGDRERLQASLQHAQKMEAVGRLAGGIAHDFNNMIAAIRFSLDSLLAQLPQGSDAGQDIETIAQATQRAMQLTRQLLTFSRHNPVDPAPCAVDDIVAGLGPMLQTLVGKEVRVSIAKTHATPVICRTDRGALEQAIVNLAVNARDAMPKGGSIRIETSLETIFEDDPTRPLAPGEYVLVSVADTGEGMAEEVMERIFEPFFSTKSEGAGTGLGLTTVYAFAKNYGGHVDVFSQVGKGTTFRIYLPRFDTTRAKHKENGTAAHHAARSTILVVDDEVLVAKAIGATLERAGHRVLIAHDGPEALRVVDAHSEEIGLALLDVRMPGMSGPELSRRFEELHLDFKVLFMSGFAPEGIGQRSNDFLEKPFAPGVLLERVDELLDT